MIFEQLTKEQLIELLKPHYSECKKDKSPFVKGEFYYVWDGLFFSEIEDNAGNIVQFESKIVGEHFK